MGTAKDNTVSALTGLRNIGPKSAAWLQAIGVSSLQDIRAMGPISIYVTLKAQGYPVSLNLVYALEGAIRDLPWTALPEKVKQSLKRSLQQV